MEYRYFSGFSDNSKFETFPGHVKRAIETQANIDLEAHKLSKCHKHKIKNEEMFFNNLCEKYAQKDEDEIKKLTILESKYLYIYPLDKDRMNFYQHQAEEQAKRMDREFNIILNLEKTNSR